MKIFKEKSLAGATTFRIGGAARFFCAVKDRSELDEIVRFAREKKLPIFILGGGSNILVSDAGFDGFVIKIEMKGIEEKERGKEGKMENEEREVLVEVGAGENWDDFVAWSVERGYGGLENLSFIPGTVGAAPVQNVGAYGVEVGDMIENVDVFDFKLNEYRTFSHDECRFSYRDSIFKREKAMPAGRQGRYIITSVTFKLKKDAVPDVSYKDLKEYFISVTPVKTGVLALKQDSRVRGNDKNIHLVYPLIADVRDAVIAIRTAKLPDICKVGTAGSFFKNPIISKQKYAKLKETYPELPSFPQADNRVKIPLAWIIDHVCGLKGKKFGKAGIHDTQALVIVNYGDASFKDVEKVANAVEKSVKEKTGIDIEREVVMV